MTLAWTAYVRNFNLYQAIADWTPLACVTTPVYLLQFGEQISFSHRNRAHFHAWGLDGRDNHEGKPPMYTLETLMKMNGHTFIDILKIE